MKRTNLVVALVTITALASGFLLLQDSMLLQPAESGRIQKEPLASVASVAKNSLPNATSFRQVMPQADSDKSRTTHKSTGDSATMDSAESSLPVEQDVTFCVKGLTAKASSVYVAVFESEAGFPNSELSSETIVVATTGDQGQFSLELRQNQPVAIAVFQDIDGNGKLSKNAIGIPIEPYGFSNNARSLLGPPSFEQAMFTISDHRDRVEPIEINVR